MIVALPFFLRQTLVSRDMKSSQVCLESISCAIALMKFIQKNSVLRAPRWGGPIVDFAGRFRAMALASRLACA